MLRRLKGRGIRLSLDDFGTGYSSLSYLHRLPIHTLKIDRSFVNRIDPVEDGDPDRPDHRDPAADLGLSVIAEGIETRAQHEALRALRCRRGQGFFFSKPLPAEQAERLLARSLPAVSKRP